MDATARLHFSLMNKKKVLGPKSSATVKLSLHSRRSGFTIACPLGKQISVPWVLVSCNDSSIVQSAEGSTLHKSRAWAPIKAKLARSPPDVLHCNEVSRQAAEIEWMEHKGLCCKGL